MGSPESLKYTYDPQNNEYAKTKAQQQQTTPNNTTILKNRSRMDRILYKFRDQKIVPTKIKLLGVSKPQPSDHFGLLTEFMLKKN
jgi:hypothetical protein